MSMTMTTTQLLHTQLCLKSLRQSLKCRLGTSTCQKRWAKIYSFQAGNIFKLA